MPGNGEAGLKVPQEPEKSEVREIKWAETLAKLPTPAQFFQQKDDIYVPIHPGTVETNDQERIHEVLAELGEITQPKIIAEIMNSVLCITPEQFAKGMTDLINNIHNRSHAIIAFDDQGTSGRSILRVPGVIENLRSHPPLGLLVPEVDLETVIKLFPQIEHISVLGNAEQMTDYLNAITMAKLGIEDSSTPTIHLVDDWILSGMRLSGDIIPELLEAMGDKPPIHLHYLAMTQYGYNEIMRDGDCRESIEKVNAVYRIPSVLESLSLNAANVLLLLLNTEDRTIDDLHKMILTVQLMHGLRLSDVGHPLMGTRGEERLPPRIIQDESGKWLTQPRTSLFDAESLYKVLKRNIEETAIPFPEETNGSSGADRLQRV